MYSRPSRFQMDTPATGTQLGTYEVKTSSKLHRNLPSVQRYSIRTRFGMSQTEVKGHLFPSGGGVILVIALPLPIIITNTFDRVNIFVKS